MEIEVKKVKKPINVYKVFGEEFKNLQEAEAWREKVKKEMKKKFFKVNYEINKEGSFKNSIIVSVDYSINNKAAVYFYMELLLCNPITFDNGFAQKNFEIIKMGKPETVEEWKEFVENKNVIHLNSDVCFKHIKGGTV